MTRCTWILFAVSHHPVWPKPLHLIKQMLQFSLGKTKIQVSRSHYHASSINWQRLRRQAFTCCREQLMLSVVVNVALRHQPRLHPLQGTFCLVRQQTFLQGFWDCCWHLYRFLSQRRLISFFLFFNCVSKTGLFTALSAPSCTLQQCKIQRLGHLRTLQKSRGLFQVLCLAVPLNLKVFLPPFKLSNNFDFTSTFYFSAASYRITSFTSLVGLPKLTISTPTSNLNIEGKWTTQKNVKHH